MLAGLLTALALMIATVGIPLPIAPIKDTSEPFPCMNCGCGCVNAEMCWRKCCCFNTEQKIAWAHKHGVKVPAYLLVQASSVSHHHEIDGTKCEDDHQDLTHFKPCCQARVLAARQAIRCTKKSGRCESKNSGSPAVGTGILAMQALKCQANTLSLSLLPPSVPTDHIDKALGLSPTDALRAVESHLYQPPFFAVVVPPPEFAVL